MGKDEKNSSSEMEFDTDFSEEFYKNIERVLSNIDTNADNSTTEENTKKQEKDEESQDNIKSDELKKNTEETIALPQNASFDDNLEEADDQLNDINAALAKQISNELEAMEAAGLEKQKKIPRWVKIQSSILVVLVLLVSFGMFLGLTSPGHKILKAMGGKIWAMSTKDFETDTVKTPDVDVPDEDVEDLTEVKPEEIVWAEHSGEGRHEDGVYNILLLGEEAIASGGARGRTDVIVIATLNTKTKKLGLTSLMRDTLVQIPGYQDNKLNSAYEKGGVELLYKTIAKNFDIKLDGCVMVNFEKFEKIIDKLGGLDITLTANEAKYLNTTNYISNPENRHVVEGTQHMNGNQVLGYSRIRKRATITGNNNDYGRTDRHRIVLNAIFEKYKTKSKVELASIMISVLPMITSDISSEQFEFLLSSFMEIGTTEIEQLRIPANDTFTDNVRVRGMDVLIPDLEKNVDALHSFIFGDTN
ncbi:MAG: hypothetical protein K0S47_1876 [Herbinix sp.]|jgi:LCP family protein required for cell wall assembly|nr:hypothetical protein [Herbinix sp.]